MKKQHSVPLIKLGILKQGSRFIYWGTEWIVTYKPHFFGKIECKQLTTGQFIDLERDTIVNIPEQVNVLLKRKEGELSFTIYWCEVCNCVSGICPKCKNNACNGTYGPAKGTIFDTNYNPEALEKCTICPLTYQYMDTVNQLLPKDVDTLEKFEKWKETLNSS